MYLLSGHTLSFLLLFVSLSSATYVLEKSATCNSLCNLTIVESIPENLTYARDAPVHPSTYRAWMDLLTAATETVDIASYYWTLRPFGNVSDVTDDQGSCVFKKLSSLASHGVNLRIVQNPSNAEFPNRDSLYLAEKSLAQVRAINISRLMSAGILHTKLWIVDQKHFYVGSANMDWRSLTQVKEMGLLGMDCECLAQDAQRLFDVYWYLSSPGATIPDPWPPEFAAMFSMDAPAKINIGTNPGTAFWSSSPPPFSVKPRTTDQEALLSLIGAAEEFIYIAVMDYLPAIIFKEPKKYWAVIDDALRAAAYERGVTVRLMGSYWNHTDKDMVAFLASLSADRGIGTFEGDIQTKLFIVPPVLHKNIPFTRVNHNKYLVTDKGAYITTSNWSGDYFLFTGGVSCVVSEPNFQNQLVQVFLRDWNSTYAHDIPHR